MKLLRLFAFRLRLFFLPSFSSHEYSILTVKALRKEGEDSKKWIFKVSGGQTKKLQRKKIGELLVEYKVDIRNSHSCMSAVGHLEKV